MNKHPSAIFCFNGIGLNIVALLVLCLVTDFLDSCFSFLSTGFNDYKILIRKNQNACKVKDLSCGGFFLSDICFNNKSHPYSLFLIDHILQ